MTRNVLYADDEPERCPHGKVIPMPDWRKQIEDGITKFCRAFWIAVLTGMLVYGFGAAYLLHRLGWWR